MNNGNKNKKIYSDSDLNCIAASLIISGSSIDGVVLFFLGNLVYWCFTDDSGGALWLVFLGIISLPFWIWIPIAGLCLLCAGIGILIQKKIKSKNN